MPIATCDVPFLRRRRALAASKVSFDVQGAGDEQPLGPFLEERLEELAQSPQDLVRSPQLEAHLVERGPEHHVLFLTLPALVGDALGLRVLVRDLAEIYAGPTVEDDEEGMQYADLAEWLNSLLEGDDEDSEVGREHWHRLDLAGLATQRLPFERTAAESTFAPHRLRRSLDDSLLSRAQSLATNHGVELETVLLAAWQVLLFHLVRQEKVVVGVAGHGRGYEELESVPGLLSRSLPVGVGLGPEVTFAALLGATEAAVTEARDWQEYFSWTPFRQALGQRAGAFFCPLAFECLPPSSKEGAVTSFQVVASEGTFDRFRLKLTVDLTSVEALGASAVLSWDDAVLSPRDVERLADQYLAVLDRALHPSDAPVSDLSILTEAELRWREEDWNATRTSYGDERPIHEMVASQAAENLRKTAVSAFDGDLTYGELTAGFQRLAAHLRHLGVTPDQRVGLAIDRSRRMPVGILGILAAGGAYVPLDPDYPEERLALMLEDSGVSILVGRQDTLAGLPEHDAQVVDLDQVLESESTGDFETVELTPHHGAYVIYTSGSTGTPRSAVITHGNLSHYVQAIAPALMVTAEDRYLHTASVAFSSSVRQLMVALSQGATVVVADSEARRDPRALAELVKERQVTVMDLVPSHWRNLIQALESLPEGERKALLDNDLRQVVSASEPLLSDVPQDWRFGLGHPARLVNMFGQTETTGIVATLPLEVAAEGPVYGVPIGRPLANTELHVLDPQMAPAAVGVPGRVYIGGQGLGRGYHGQPGRTAEKLVPHPHSSHPGERLYDTGDLARFRSDGLLDFLGRNDHQVKIRGLRVELGEIEAALGEHPAVSRALVVAHRPESGDPRLVAYMVPRTHPGPSAEGLRVFLQGKLPEPMIPAVWIPLEELPQTPSGKIDRQALPAPSLTRDALDTVYVAPSNEAEEKLAAIWVDLLQVDRVGVQDNFFRLGGHSLLATVLMSRVRDTFHVDLPVLRLFEAPTVAGLSQVIHREAPGAPSQDQEIQPEIVAQSRREEELLEQVDQLSETDLDSLLGEMMSQKEVQ